jgi:hypothetical protein
MPLPLRLLEIPLKDDSTPHTTQSNNNDLSTPQGTEHVDPDAQLSPETPVDNMVQSNDIEP